MRRATQTGTGRGQIIGVASIDFYAGPDRSLKGCTVHWDSDPGFVPLLPALAFDEYLPNVRLIGVSTDAGEGVIVGEHAQQVRLGEFEAWIASQANARTDGCCSSDPRAVDVPSRTSAIARIVEVSGS